MYFAYKLYVNALLHVCRELGNFKGSTSYKFCAGIYIYSVYSEYLAYFPS